MLDLHFEECYTCIRNKPKLRFRTKTGKSREITIEAGLLRNLKSWKKKNTGKRFIFGTAKDQPNGHLLEACKRTAKRAGLFCAECPACMKENAKWESCDRWYLHKFRASFATWSLQAGVLRAKGGLASARESLCRGLGSRWFTERFHGNALVTHFQHGQVFCTARRLENHAVARCRLRQRAPQR